MTSERRVDEEAARRPLSGKANNPNTRTARSKGLVFGLFAFPRWRLGRHVNACHEQPTPSTNAFLRAFSVSLCLCVETGPQRRSERPTIAGWKSARARRVRRRSRTPAAPAVSRMCPRVGRVAANQVGVQGEWWPLSSPRLGASASSKRQHEVLCLQHHPRRRAGRSIRNSTRG